MGPAPLGRVLPLVGAVAVLLGGLCLGPRVGRAQPVDPAPVPQLSPPPELGALQGRPVRRIEVVEVGERWHLPMTLRRVRLGEPLTVELAQRALRELIDTGRYANASASATPEADGVLLTLLVVPRRLVASIRWIGGPLEEEAARRAAAVREGDEITPPDLPTIAARIRKLYLERGFPSAEVKVDTLATDHPLRVVLVIEVEAGPAQSIAGRVFAVAPSPPLPELAAVLGSYDVAAGDRVDEELLEQADKALQKRLQDRGWFHATVSHRIVSTHSGSRLLRVLVNAGPRVRLRFEGNRRFDMDQLQSALDIEEREDRTPDTLALGLREFYERRGFFDVEVTPTIRSGRDHRAVDYVFRIREGQPLRVATRYYPCLTGERSTAQVSSEIDSFLAEALPGGGFFGTVDSRIIDDTFGPTQATGRRSVPFDLDPYRTYVPEVYERALEHLQDLFRSEGYLSALVGPVHLVRRRCHPLSAPDECRPLGPRRRPAIACDPEGTAVPVELRPPDPQTSCVPDPARGVTCEPEVVLYIPIKLGARTYLYDIAFEGNQLVVEEELRELAELELGAPLAQADIDKARRRLLDAYAEQGLAFAEVDALLDLSSDHTRARIRFIVNEREPVRVSRIVVRGAKRTSERLIRSRIALRQGDLFRRSLVRKTEERLATLGVFSTVTVALQDPTVPAREKVVEVTVQERPLQYLDVRPGFSTGDGFRITFEYGHRNLASEAIQLTLRSQLGLLPTVFIFEEDVRRNYEKLDLDQRLERRNSATLELPEIGLGPLFRLSLELVDVRDNARDFGLTKDAAIVTVAYRPDPRFSAQVGVSLERNDPDIFSREPLREFIQRNPTLANRFRVPDAVTVALAERIGVTWDRRDSPLDATKGTFVSAGVEHVRASPIGDIDPATQATDPFAATESQFLRFTNRVAGYIRLSETGLALATSFRWGWNKQLRDGSRTYPDRLFFLGGVDSLRGFLQDALVPEDIARELLRGTFSLNEVVIRGGDVFINPRAELRIPVSASVQTAVFVDTGNLWSAPERLDNAFALRYSAGSGIRIVTPIGPLVFDYGFNIERVLDDIFPDRTRQRFWEDLGAFHFSIGVF